MEPATPSIDALESHREFLRSFATALLGGSDGAEDVVQDAWLVALTRPPRKPGSLRSFLAGAVRNLALTVRRRESRRRHLLLHAASGRPEPSPSEIAAREETRRLVLDALLALDDLYRRPLLLRYYEGLPHREVAARLGVPIETARTRMKRGLDRLRDQLDGNHGGDRRAWALALLPLLVPKPAAAAFKVAALLVALAGAGAVWFAAQHSAGKRPDVPDPVPVVPRVAAAETGSGPPPVVEKDPPPAESADPLVVRGRVLNEKNRPVADALVMAMDPADIVWATATLRTSHAQIRTADCRHHLANTTRGHARSGPDGRFSLRLKKAEPLVLVGVKRGWLMEAVPVPEPGGEATVRVRPGGVLVVRLVGPEGPTEDGTVWLHSDDDELDVESSTNPVEVWPLHPGRFKVYGAGGDFRNHEGVEVDIGPGEERRVELLLSPVVTKPVDAYTVRLLDDTGAPLDERTPTRWKRWTAHWDGGGDTALLDEEGRLRLRAPKGAAVVLTNGRTGRKDFVRSELRPGGGEQEIRLPFRLPPRKDPGPATSSVRGRVVDREGRGVPRAGLGIQDGAGKWHGGETDEHGYFLREGLHAGPWFWQASARGYLRTSGRFDRLPVEDLVVTLEPERGVRLMIRTPRGDYAEGDGGARPEGGEMQRSGLDAFGACHFRDLPPGPCLVTGEVPTPDGGALLVGRVELLRERPIDATLSTKGYRRVTLRHSGKEIPPRFRFEFTVEGAGVTLGVELETAKPVTVLYPPTGGTPRIGWFWRDLEPVPPKSLVGNVTVEWTK